MPGKYRSNEEYRQGVMLGTLLGTWNIMWLSTTLRIIIEYNLSCVRAEWTSASALSYYKEDFYFDRLVALTLNMHNSLNDKDYVNIAVGVLISNNQVLTSYNPFRRILHNKTLWKKLLATTIYGRRRRENGLYSFYLYRHKINCGRQVQFLPDENIKDHLWHGADRRHCPLHDLLVLRINADISFSQVPSSEYTPKDFPDVQDTSKEPGIFYTQLATPIDSMGAYFRFATLGLEDNDIHNYRAVKTVEYEPDDNALVSCDDWFPQEWGYFICILNKDNHQQLGSSAMLVSDELVFGVGSFTLFRGNQSIMVFTDVRPYHGHTYRTCTYFDSDEQHPQSFPKPSWDP